jgi:hypothetical protein
MAKKASKTKKIKKAKPAKHVAKAKAKATKPAKKAIAKKKAVKPAKAKKAAKPVIKKKAPVKNIKPVKPTVKKAEAKPKVVVAVGVKPAVKFDTERVQSPPELIKPKKAARVPKAKKIKQVFVPFNPIQPANSTGKPVNTSKKEPKGKFELEYVIRCSEPLLYEFTTSPSGLSEWFADDVNIRDGIYTFIWDGSQQDARLIALKEDAYVRYQWVDKSDGSYFEFRIQTDELTGDVSLIIVDFADNEEEQLSSKLLWDAQVDKLMKTIGSHG